MINAILLLCAIIKVVPSGKTVDAKIKKLIPQLANNYMIIKTLNSDIRDTIRRTKDIVAHGLTFIGIGVSGGV
jgi:6-phosphogluconate dehydrogenase